jgi:hypothetical protein
LEIDKFITVYNLEMVAKMQSFQSCLVLTFAKMESNLKRRANKNWSYRCEISQATFVATTKLK